MMRTGKNHKVFFHLRWLMGLSGRVKNGFGRGSQHVWVTDLQEKWLRAWEKVPAEKIVLDSHLILGSWHECHLK